MRTRTKFAAVIAALATIPASAVSADARPVALSDARVQPDHVQVLKPGAIVSAGVCRDEATDFHAYARDGGAIGAQQRVRSGWRWQGSGGYIRYRTDVQDGPGQWINSTSRPVLVAVWCG